MADNISTVWSKFFAHRTRTLWERFPGYYRALVVETNDPLGVYRIKFKCPDMHDFTISAADCPWAVPSHDLGGARASRFSHPCIGDWVWITFEKQHPYGPIWVGFATPTRIKNYSYPQIFQATPVPVNPQGRPTVRPNDYDHEYLPKDGRPMMHGWNDRYGHLDIHSAVGYFPESHKNPPPPPDHDAVQGAAFTQQTSTPVVNDPDKKYMARVTKYGIQMIQSDQGYYWQNEGEFGEFDGNTQNDEEFEIKRWQTIQRMLNEGSPTADARRFAVINRYGSRLELRETGWAQSGPIKSTSRDGEFGPARVLSKEDTNDYRWNKLRSKGGMLFQQYDKGAHPNDDAFIKRPISQELGARSEREDLYWANKDARQQRLVTRYGFKIVQDDRGSDPIDAHRLELPRGNGILIKGRRSPGAKMIEVTGNPRGFFWEFNENDAANHTMWGSPMGQAIEMNDRYQYMMMTVSLGRNFAARYQGLKENEFIRKPTMLRDPEKSAYHLKLDHDNEYLRLKTRGGRGPRPMDPVNASGVRDTELQQGFEARDGQEGDGPWTEMVDCQHRGMWFSKRHRLGVWRAQRGGEMYQWMDDEKKKIVIYNNEETGAIEIFCAGKINLISKDDININADNNINLRAGKAIRMQADTTRLTVAKNLVTNHDIMCRKFYGDTCKLKVRITTGIARGSLGEVIEGCPRPGGDRVGRVPFPAVPNKIEPEDRAATYNGPFDECPQDEVEHPL